MTKYINKILFFGPILAAMAFISTGCTSRSGKPDRVQDILASDSIPEPVKKMVKAVSSDDSDTFADMVSYPIKRQYPLHDIENKEEMKRNYKKIVDDSLKNVVTHSGPEDWTDYGWLGMSISGGEYVFVADSITDIPYMSVEEKMERDSLVKADIASLHESLRDGWEPVRCDIGTHNGRIYRIDSNIKKDRKGRGERRDLRMLIYRDRRQMDSIPSQEYSGYEETEGTEMTATYIFTDNRGDKALYQPDPTDGSRRVIIFTDTTGKETNVDVTPVYWLELRKEQNR